MQVVVDVEAFYRSELGTIGGVVYVQADDFAYPDEGWTDLAVEILEQWVEAVGTLQYLDAKSSVALRFMRGPYSIKLRRLDEYTAHVQCIRDRVTHYSVDYELDIDIALFRKSLKKAVQQVINKCQREGWQSPYVDTLAMRLKTLSV